MNDKTPTTKAMTAWLRQTAQPSESARKRRARIVERLDWDRPVEDTE